MTQQFERETMIRHREFSHLFQIRYDRVQQLRDMGEYSPVDDDPWLDEARQWMLETEADMLRLMQTVNAD